MQGRCAYGNYSCIGNKYIFIKIAINFLIKIDCKETFDCEAVKNHTSCKSE